MAMQKLAPQDHERNPLETISDADLLNEVERRRANRIADRVIAQLGNRAGDEMLDRARVEAEFHIRFRVVIDAARRGEIVLDRANRKPLVRRAELDRWLSSRRAPRVLGSAESDYAAIVGEAE